LIFGQQRNIKFNFKLAVFLSQKITSAINFMHSKGIIHNTITPENILLNKDEIKALVFPVITDFSSAKNLKSNIDIVYEANRSDLKNSINYYVSPETIQSIRRKERRVSNVETDTYSVGICFYEMFSRTPLATLLDSDTSDILPMLNIKQISDHWAEKVDLRSAESIFKFILNCLDSNPKTRPNLRVFNETLCS
jgi:serine/threonine protein kinase